MTGSLALHGGEAGEVIVRGPNWLGDLVMSTPGLRALRRGLPAARITLAVRAGLEPLLEGSPLVDDVVTIDSYHRGARALIREARAFGRARRYDLGLCIPDSISAALHLRCAGVRDVVGYAGRGRSLLLHHAVPVPESWGPGRMVARERFVLGLVEAVGCAPQGLELELHVDPAEQVACEAMLAERGLAGAAASGRLVGLAPGASYGDAKRWPAEHYAEMADVLVRAGFEIVLLGAGHEAVLTGAVARGMREPAHDLAGVLDLSGWKALIRRLALLVCNDAGARHVAVAFGVPALVFFGPTSVARTDCNLAGVTIFEREEDCRPCYRRRCPIDHRCLRRIEPAPVAEAALRLLARPRVGSLGSAS